MFHPRCSNCSYELVLLSSRSKYKCSLCSKLFLQKLIENREFREWNKRKRKGDFENSLIEEEKEFCKLEEINKRLRFLFIGHLNPSKEERKKTQKEYYKVNSEKTRQKWKEYYSKNKEKIFDKNDRWRENNKEKIALTSKRWLENNREKKVAYLKAYKLRNQSLERQSDKLRHWRRRQNKLTDQYLENEGFNVYNINFYPFSPTFALCELLS